MIYQDPKPASLTMPVIVILMTMAGIVLFLLSNAGSEGEDRVRVFVNVDRDVGR